MAEQFEIGKNGVTYANVRNIRSQKQGTNFQSALRNDMTTHEVPIGALPKDYAKAYNNLTGNDQKLQTVAIGQAAINKHDPGDLRAGELFNWDKNATPLANPPERPAKINLTRDEANKARVELRGEEKTVGDALANSITKYTVKPGDTLGEIALNSKQIGVNKEEDLQRILEKIAKQNHLQNPNDIKIGQVIDWKL